MCFDLRNNNRNKILSFNEIWPDLTWDSHTADVLCFQTCPPKAGNKKLTVTYVFIFVYKCQVSVHIPLPLFENFQSILPKSFCVNLVPTLSLHDDTYHVLQSISPWNQNHQIFLNCSWKQLHMIYWLGSQKYPWMTTMFFSCLFRLLVFLSYFNHAHLIVPHWCRSCTHDNPTLVVNHASDRCRSHVQRHHILFITFSHSFRLHFGGKITSLLSIHCQLSCEYIASWPQPLTVESLLKLKIWKFADFLSMWMHVPFDRALCSRKYL